MSLKRTIHENCPKCGAINAVAEGDIVRVFHSCGSKYVSPPRSFRRDDVIFVPSLLANAGGRA